jgi:YrbI family 3-deoxy-D-manno-octulosonate 8-phosphate phosphatase
MRAEVLGVVPARGGSKSIPRKNARLLGGHPLIAYSIAAGLSAGSVTRLIVSTDNLELAAIAREYGAEVPFLRPAELARDDTPDLPLFQHALDFLKEKECYEPDLVVQLRPTSPLRPVDLVDRAVEKLLSDSVADCVRGVTLANQTPYKMWKLREDAYLHPLLEIAGLNEPYNAPRQSLPPIFWQTGHVDAVRRETIQRDSSLTGKRVLPIVVDRQYCVDIDSEADWTYAAWLLSRGSYNGLRPQRRASAGDRVAKRPLPFRLSLLVFDFDGVLTDNRVWVSEEGVEAVACNRSDGLAIDMLRKHGVEMFVLSKEKSPVVGARCVKLRLPHQQGIDDKHAALRSLTTERGISLDEVVYLGNDVNDLECMLNVACGVAVADAHPDVLARADLVLNASGGRGAIRELCDLVIAGLETRSKQSE